VSVIENLLVVQEHDSRIKRIEREIADIPDLQKRELARLDSLKSSLADAENLLKQKQSEIKQIDLDNESKREQVTKLRQQQMTLKTNKEFKAMEDEIRGVMSDISKVEDKELVVMEEIESFVKDCRQKKESLEKEQQKVSEDISRLNERKEKLEEDIADIKIQRQTAAEAVDPEILSRYERIFERKEPALVEFRDGICTGCHMTLPPSVSHDVKKRDGLLSCDFCGRMLY